MQSDRIDSLAVNFWRTTLKIFNAADFGIVPNEDISEKLAEFISALKAEDGEKTAVFDSGTYHITVDPKLFMPAVTPYLAAFYALALNLGYGFFLRLASVFDKFKRQPRAGLRRALGSAYHFISD